ncbi:AraC family transcriptional regulator ligand-binding domain-containing protein [Dactylosporangium sp. AC04546]|uniref:AraC family transcriptional regulator n=1 Tax=Dactylosporangium sp. AC04546 TaxID=2862460 RepID=UPI001EDF2059|nr:AraC family transcriptional regulator [Dactylosporangium sp. AC04546]WVK88507.1 AraC family transcriptional regulator ligand-binding domain-containing protein [Dactylosporangium sp. AC04546]
MAGYALEPGYGVLLHDLGIEPAAVLRRAGLPGDLLARGPVSLPAAEFFALWKAIEDEGGDAVRVAETLSAEVFSAPLFAALCSPDLAIAAQRIAEYKRLVGPMRLDVDGGTFTNRWPGGEGPPRVLVLVELLFWVALARLGTRHDVRPLRVCSPEPPADRARYQTYLGVTVEPGPAPSITFAAHDLARPFVTANEPMWALFEPELRRRLSAVDRDASTAERVRAALLELMPAGRATMPAVARALATSTRTLQRRLSAERTSFQAVLGATRTALAEHYLGRADLTPDQISFLLGYDDPKSFYRAFRGWTGTTPAAVRLWSR